MISVSAFSGKTVAVMGLGKSGLSAAEALAARRCPRLGVG